MSSTPSDEDPVHLEPLLTLLEAARRLHISRSFMYELIRKGVLPVVRIGGVLRFRPEDVEALIGKPLPRPSKSKRDRKRGQS